MPWKLSARHAHRLRDCWNLLVRWENFPALAASFVEPCGHRTKTLFLLTWVVSLAPLVLWCTYLNSWTMEKVQILLTLLYDFFPGREADPWRSASSTRSSCKLIEEKSWLGTSIWLCCVSWWRDMEVCLIYASTVVHTRQLFLWCQLCRK